MRNMLLGLAVVWLLPHLLPAQWSPVPWATPRGAITSTGVALEKTGPSNAWTADIASANLLVDDCAVRFTASTTNKNLVAGFNRHNQHFTPSELDYAFYLRSNGTFTIYEKGRARTLSTSISTSYSAGDEFRIQRSGDQIEYFHQGSRVYLSQIPSRYPVLIDVSFATIGGQIVSVERQGASVPLTASGHGYDADFDGLPNGVDSAPSIPAAIDDQEWQDYFDFDRGESWETVIWGNNYRVTFPDAVPSNPKLSPSVKRTAVGPSANWNYANASSEHLMPADGAVRFRPHGGDIDAQPCGSVGASIVGLSRHDSHANYVDLEYAFYAYHSSLAIYENGNFIAGVFNPLDHGEFTFEPGDILQIRREDGIVSYWRNNQKIYTSETPCHAPLRVDTSFFRHNDQFTHCQTTGFEALADFDNTGVPTLDDDGDSLPNAFEAAVGLSTTDPADAVLDLTPGDGDSWSAYEEFRLGSDPLDEDDPGSPPDLLNPWNSVGWDLSGLSPLGNQVGVGSGFQKPSVANGGVNGFNAGASGDSAFAEDFEFRFRFNDYDAINMIGINDDPSFGNSYADIDYALYSYSNGVIYIYENGSYQGKFAAVDPATVFSIRRTGTLVDYLADGRVIHTSPEGSDLGLSPDAAVYHPNAGIDYAQHLDVASGSDGDGDGINDAWELLHLSTIVYGADSDTDYDGLSLSQERAEGTSAGRFDTDGDGIGDGQELAEGTNPLDGSDGLGLVVYSILE